MCFFFFKQKTAYEMRISDWSSDVCSSDLSSDLALVLAAGQVLADLPEGYATVANFRSKGVPRPNRILLSGSFFIYVVGSAVLSYVLLRNAPDALKMAADRKSVVEGKSVSVRVDLGGRRIFKKKKKK